MAKWQSSNTGLLTVEDLKDGDLIKFLEEPYQNKTFTNVKVELPNGEHKLGSINDFSGQYLSEAWGAEMAEWKGRIAKVGIRLGKMSGKEYYVLYPTDGKDESLVDNPLTEAQKAEIKALREQKAQEPTAEQIAGEEIPF